MSLNIKKLNVKAGDEVCYIPAYPQGNSEKNWFIMLVEKVTPTGQIVLVNGERFDATGSEIAKQQGRYSSKASIREASDELRARVKHAKNIQFLCHFAWDKVKDREALEDVIVVLKLHGVIE